MTRGELARRGLEVDGRAVLLTVRRPSPMTEDGEIQGFFCEGVIRCRVMSQSWYLLAVLMRSRQFFCVSRPVAVPAVV